MYITPTFPFAPMSDFHSINNTLLTYVSLFYLLLDPSTVFFRFLSFSLCCLTASGFNLFIAYGFNLLSFLFFLILPVDLVQERCLVTVFLTNLSPRALQVHTADSLSENLKNTQWCLCGRWRSDAQVSDKNPKKLRENMLCRTLLKAHNPSRMSRNEKRTSANSFKVTFIARFVLSPGRYAFGRVARIQPCTCRHLGWDSR